jgi:hypothetical protein
MTWTEFSLQQPRPFLSRTVHACAEIVTASIPIQCVDIIYFPFIAKSLSGKEGFSLQVLKGLSDFSCLAAGRRK